MSSFKKHSIDLKVINLGGGFPARYTKDVPSIKDVSKVINGALKDLVKDGYQIYIEPGRRIVAESGVLVASVVNRATRSDEEWLYLDVGVFHGLQETLEGFRYEIVTPVKSKKKIPYILAGSSCDSVDKFMDGILLPDNLTVGDKIFILSTGAYTTSMEHYNGIPYPETIIE